MERISDIFHSPELAHVQKNLQARTWKQPRCSLTDEWIKKLWYIYIYHIYIYIMEYYSAIKRKAFESVLVRWMKL